MWLFHSFSIEQKEFFFTLKDPLNSLLELEPSFVIPEKLLLLLLLLILLFALKSFFIILIFKELFLFISTFALLNELSNISLILSFEIEFEFSEKKS